MSYSPQSLLDSLGAALSELGSGDQCLVGLSGGLDSVVLLHALASLREQSHPAMKLRAIHVNHQLQPAAADWELHCQKLCTQLGIECITRRVEIPDSSGIENAAREARYREFEAALSPAEVLLLAHHRDDQMETVLLRLMRGAGSRGLGGIPASRALGASRLLRPLLAIDRAELLQYGETCELSWIEDESNADTSFDRNYCRHQLLPLIEARWPGYRESVSKSAVLAAESEALLQDLAAIDLTQIVAPTAGALQRDKLLALPEPRRRNLLRHWLQSLGAADLSWNQLQQLSVEILGGAESRFLADGFQLHCYRDKLYALADDALNVLPEAMPLAELRQNAALPLANNGSLQFREAEGAGLVHGQGGSLSIRYRQGGETCRLSGRPSKSLKKILQESELPPWLRGRIPLLYHGEDLACIPGVGVCDGFAAKPGEAGYLVDWQPPDMTLRA